MGTSFNPMTDIISNSVVEVTEITSSSNVSSTEIVSDSRIEVGAQGPAGQSSDEFITGQNNDSVIIRRGQAVSVHSSGVGFVLADKSALFSRAVGLANEDVSPGFSLSVRTAGEMEILDWTNVIGSVSLGVKSRYFLGISGGLIPFSTAVSGEISQVLGEALGPQKFLVRVDEPIVRS